MPGRRLHPEELALWERVADTVRPVRARTRAALPPPSNAPPSDAPVPITALPFPSQPTRASSQNDNTLDGSWDRRLAQGRASPDFTLDLHGCTLATAHSRLDHGLETAISSNARVMLLITGKPPVHQPDSGAAPRRGLIRASIAHWLASSRHAADIAAVRNAHPRHGGGGALYIIFRRKRGAI
jgi:DNA-nicking Smr family endonuclease